METVLVTSAFLLSFFGHTTYAQEAPAIPIPITISSTSPLFVRLKIKAYADFYDVSEDTMNSIIKAESAYNPKARNTTSKEDSVGIAQINLKAHKSVTKEQAEDVDFSLEFLAKNLANNNCRIWTTCPE
jgi:hypothetical protein